MTDNNDGIREKRIKQVFHGKSKTPEYQAWQNLKNRCYNTKNLQYKDYGGRGITVCDEWKDSFMAFYEVVGDRPSPKHSLDRIDNDGNYEPDNVRWAEPRAQAINQRMKSTNTTGINGISWSKRHKKYQVQLSVNYKKYWIGRYKTLNDAVCALIAFHVADAKKEARIDEVEKALKKTKPRSHHLKQFGRHFNDRGVCLRGSYLNYRLDTLKEQSFKGEQNG